MYTFRPKSVNEEHYNQKMRFWKDMILNYCEYKGSSKVTISELKQVFKRNGTMPYCLDEVFQALIADSNLTEKSEFMQQPKSLAGWAIDTLVFKPLGWGLGKIKEKLTSTTIDEQTSFVVQSAVAAQSELLIEHVRSRHSHNIISMDTLMQDLPEGLSKDGILLALHHLSAVEKSVYIEEVKETDAPAHHHKLLLKFAETNCAVSPITDIERSLYNLEQTEKFLHDTIDKKEQQLNDVVQQVRDTLKNGKKQLAKTFLRKKHQLEADLIKTINVLDNIQTMIHRVHSSKNDREILNTYKMGSDAIKTAFSENGVNLDNVHDVIEDMQEIYEKQEEYESAISEPLRGPIDIDDSELEKELMDLMNVNDPKSNNDGGTAVPSKPNAYQPDLGMELIDRELEMRLKRLRSDFVELEETKKMPQQAPTLI